MDKTLLSDYGFLLIRPDAYKNNLSNDILQCIIGQGFVLVAAKTLIVTPSQFEKIYEKKANLFVPNIWLFGNIYRSTPCVAMVFKRSTNTDSKPVPEIFDKLKGNSSPTICEQKGLREQFGRISSFHGVVHCSDSIEACLNDLQIVFSKYELDNIFNQEFFLHEKLKSKIIQFYLENDEGKINSFDVIQFNVYLIKKVISTLCVRCISQLTKSEIDNFENLFIKYDNLSIALNEISGFTQRVKIFSKFQYNNKDEIINIVCNSFCFDSESIKIGIDSFEEHILKSDLNLLKLSILVLGAFEGYNNFDFMRFLSVLERGGVYLTEWQQNVLLSALTTDLNADRYWGGKPCYEMVK